MLDVYLIFMNGADKYWKVVREESWKRLNGESLDPVVIEDIKGYEHPEDVEDAIEILENYTLKKNDVAMYLPPILIGAETGELFSATTLTEFVSRHNLKIVAEFTCHM
jgi:hypothetical protein